MFEEFGSGGGFDVNKINGLAMDWDPTPILQALQNFSGSGATMDQGVAPAYPGMPNPESVQTPWGTDPGGKPQDSLGDIMYGKAAPAAPAAPAEKTAAPLTPQQMVAMGAMMPKPPTYRPGPAPVAPGNHTRNVQFANIASGQDPRAPRTPSLAEILTGRRG